ncbi:MAG: aspartate kinase [Crocinitomicaceae bacterium]|nr:aspartate kinase [Crocinitomicaceae bacterium]
MLSIGKITEDIINRSPFLREAMGENLINVSSLARKIKPEIEKTMGCEVKEGAIIMAIKRMSPGVFHKVSLKLVAVMGNLGDFLVRNDLIDLTFQNSVEINAIADDLMNLLESEPEGFYTISRGVTETTIIANTSLKDKLLLLLKDSNLKSVNENLASITVKLPKLNVEMYGIYYYILKHLAWEGLNIMQIISTANEFTIVLNEDEIERAFKVLIQLKQNN